MDNQDELNFRRFEEIYPVYRDMGRKVKAEFQKAKEIDLFNTKENQSLKDRIKELEEDNKRLTNCLMDAQTLWERLKPKIVGVEVGLARNELNKIIGRTI